MYKNYGPKKLIDVVEEVTKPIWEEHGAVGFKVMANWQRIVGTRMAQISTPLGVTHYRDDPMLEFIPKEKEYDDKIQTISILTLGVENPGFSLEIQANSNLIIEKIATYFGYRAIDKIKLQIIPKRNDKVRSIKTHTVQPKAHQIDSKSIDQVEDEEIRRIILSIAQNFIS